MFKQIIIGLLCINFFLFSGPTRDWEELSEEKKLSIIDFFVAIQVNNIEFIKSNIHLVGEDYTPYWNSLGCAIKYKRTEIVKRLIAAQAPLDHIIKGFKYPVLNYSLKATAVCCAALFGNKECVELLLDAGADPSIPAMFKKTNGQWYMDSLYTLLHLSFIEKSCIQEDHKFFEDICKKYTIKPYENEKIPKDRYL